MGDPGNPDMGEADKAKPSKVIKVLANYWAVQQSPDNTPNKQQDVKIREKALGRLKVDDSWKTAQKGLSSILEMADDPTRKGEAASLVDRIDFTRPVEDPINKPVLDVIQTKAGSKDSNAHPAQEAKTEKPKNKTARNDEINADFSAVIDSMYPDKESEWYRVMHMSGAEKKVYFAVERQKEKIEEAKAASLQTKEIKRAANEDGRKLAEMIYDPGARKRITEFLDYIVNKRKGVFGNLSRTRERFIADLKKSGHVLTASELENEEKSGKYDDVLQVIRKVSWSIYYDGLEEIKLQSGEFQIGEDSLSKIQNVDLAIHNGLNKFRSSSLEEYDRKQLGLEYKRYFANSWAITQTENKSRNENTDVWWVPSLAKKR